MKLSGMFRMGAALGVGVVAAVGLTGCAGSGQLEIFSERQTAEDLLPAGGSGPEFDVDTSRFLWTGDGVSYFATLSPEGTCLVIVVGDNPLSANCAKNLPIQVSAGGEPSVILADDLPDSSDQWEKVADHLWREK